jgi:NADH-quinone oxidoreductase subunit A
VGETAGDRRLPTGMDSQLKQYLPVLMLLFVAVNFAVGTLIVSVVAGKLGRRTKTKDIPYECGMPPQGEGNARLSVKFYLVALLFVLFDIEVVFMYPWAVTYKELVKTDPATGLGGMLSFMVILFAGYIYALKKRAFDWKS